MGWLKYPERSLSESHHGVEITQQMLPKLIGGYDPDVSFAYMFSGSIGTMIEAESTADRGREKAKFDWRGLPDELIPEAIEWSQMLKRFDGKKELQVQVQCDAFSGRCFVHPDFGVSFRDRTAIVTLRDGEDERTMVIEDEVLIGTDLKKWLSSARRRMKSARTLVREIERLNVGFE